MTRNAFSLFLALLAAAPLFAAAPSWTSADTDAILSRTTTVLLAPDLSGLTTGEKTAVTDLLQAGAIMERIYEDARHPQALAALQSLEVRNAKDGSENTDRLLELYRLFKGPIAAALDNDRVPFLPVEPETPGKNVYPLDATREEIDGFLAKHPDQRDSILGERTVVRRATPASLRNDLAVLGRFPALDTLHPDLRSNLERLAASPDPAVFYAVPQSVAWPVETMKTYALLNHAADAVEGDDSEFAGYLRNRARDLISDHYESGDASWITGNFNHLNAQIGSYETYDDALYGVKAFHSLSILLRNEAATKKLRAAMGGLQAIEDSLPYEHHKKVREDIPVGVYEVIADFGQSRGGNTASILPNDALYARRYGRTILLRENIMRNDHLFANTEAAWAAAVAPPLVADLRPDGNFNRTLWHEVGHYLGVDRAANGQTLDVALEADSDTFEEMKADLVSLYGADALRKAGYYDDAALRSVYASGIRRTLQNNRPRADQPYQTMQLMQFNWFFDKGLLQWDPNAQVLSIDYDRYHQVVGSLLKEVLAIQDAGDRDAADAFIAKWTDWKDDLHGVLAQKIRNSQKFRYALFRYAALDEPEGRP